MPSREARFASFIMSAASKPFFIVIALVLLLMLLSWHLTHDDGQLITINTAKEIQPCAAHLDFDKFRLDDFSITEQKDNVTVFTLSATQLTHRKRKSRFFIYQNLKEIYLYNARINILPPNEKVINIQASPIEKFVAAKPLTIPFDLIGKSFESLLGSSLLPSKDYFSGNSDINLDIVSRMLIEVLALQITLPNNQYIAIKADSARVLTDFQYMVFAGNFCLAPSDGETLQASEAVWSCKDKGFFFPNGYTQQNRAYDGPAFYEVMTNGKLLRRSSPLLINYADPLDEKENELQKYIAQRMPLTMRLFLGLTKATP